LPRAVLRFRQRHACKNAGDQAREEQCRHEDTPFATKLARTLRRGRTKNKRRDRE
jgi:hypothetical protein